MRLTVLAAVCRDHDRKTGDFEGAAVSIAFIRSLAPHAAPLLHKPEWNHFHEAPGASATESSTRGFHLFSGSFR